LLRVRLRFWLHRLFDSLLLCRVTPPPASSPLSLHDALPIFADRTCFVRYDERGCGMSDWRGEGLSIDLWTADLHAVIEAARPPRSEEHTSELQSRENLVCRLLLEKKKPSVVTVNSPSIASLL